MRKLNIFCLPGKFNLDFYQGALPEGYVYLHYLDTRHQSRVVIHNEVMIVCGRTPLIKALFSWHLKPYIIIFTPFFNLY